MPELLEEIITADPEDFVLYKPFKSNLDKISSISNVEKYVYIDICYRWYRKIPSMQISKPSI